MTDAKIAIASKNKELSRIIELEGILLGFSPDIFAEYNQVTEEYDLCFIDTAELKQPPSALSKHTVFVVYEESKYELPSAYTENSVILEYPINIDKIREIYLSLFKEQTEKAEEQTVCFYKNSPNTVSCGGRTVLLSEKEKELLALLCKNEGAFVPKEELRKIFEGGSLQVYIFKLRKKLEGSSGKKIILTERSKGYKINLKTEWK